MKATQRPLPGATQVVLNEAKIATLLREVLVAKLHEAASLILMTLVLVLVLVLDV
ncbi:hypothetical protein D3C80_1603120 [compost metagenome]